jgi:hypothetical protein
VHTTDETRRVTLRSLTTRDRPRARHTTRDATPTLIPTLARGTGI